MGWNSYNAFGSNVTEPEFLANASYVNEKLLPSGYDTVVVDFRWADTGPSTGSMWVYRGGCWDSDGPYCRSAYRNMHSPDGRDPT